jgi:hypothetical protein
MKTIERTPSAKPPKKTNLIPFYHGLEPREVTVTIERAGFMVSVILPKRLLPAITRPHPKMGGEYYIPCASVENPRDVESRVSCWTKGLSISGSEPSPSISELFGKSRFERCDSRIEIIIPKHEWAFVVEVSQRLGIGVNDWFMAGAAWAAWHREFFKSRSFAR